MLRGQLVGCDVAMHQVRGARPEADEFGKLGKRDYWVGAETDSVADMSTTGIWASLHHASSWWRYCDM